MIVLYKRSELINSVIVMVNFGKRMVFNRLRVMILKKVSNNGMDRKNIYWFIEVGDIVW